MLNTIQLFHVLTAFLDFKSDACSLYFHNREIRKDYIISISYKNAYRTYSMIKDFDGYNEKDLLKAHGIMKIKSKETLRESYLNPAIENGLVRMMFPDKPTSKNQRYIKC